MQKCQGNRVRNDDVIRVFRERHRARHLFRLSRLNKQLLDEVEQNIVICQWRADQLFADAEGRGK